MKTYGLTIPTMPHGPTGPTYSTPQRDHTARRMAMTGGCHEGTLQLQRWTEVPQGTGAAGDGIGLVAISLVIHQHQVG